MFHNLGRLDADPVDATRRNLDNQRYSNYVLGGFALPQEEHVKFATNQPSFMFNGLAHGNGLTGHSVDTDSQLMIKTNQGRTLEKLQLNQRPFITVPYLGKGSINPDVESRLLQGEMSYEVKSVSTASEQSFLDHTFNSNDKMKDIVANAKVEESALDGWVRGGSGTRS